MLLLLFTIYPNPFIPSEDIFNQEFAEQNNYIKEIISVKLKVGMLLITSRSTPRGLQ